MLSGFGLGFVLVVQVITSRYGCGLLLGADYSPLIYRFYLKFNLMLYTCVGKALVLYDRAVFH